MRPDDFTNKIWKHLIAVSAFMMIVSPVLLAEKTGDYFREDQNVGKVDKTLDRIEGLLFRLCSSTGVTVDDNGAVTGWTDQSGKGNNFSSLKKAKIPVRLENNVIAGKPALVIKNSRHKSGGFVSQPIAIDPQKGMTMAILARVNKDFHLGNLLCYGRQYKTPGSLGIGLRGYSKYKRTWWRVNVNSKGECLESTDDNIAGKGFILFVVRFDPKTKELTMYQNGVLVGKTIRTEPLAEKFPFGIGVDPGGQWSFDGDVLEAIAYNRALTRSQLRTLNSGILAKYGLGGKPVSAMAPQLPYAYYPSKNQMEVAIELSPELLQKAGKLPKEVGVKIIDLKTKKCVAKGSVPLDGQSRGQTVFDVPDFPDGEYAVEYVIGNHVERSPKTFKRIHFPFEKTSYGVSHKVVPPFTPVKVDGKTVSVIGRSYTLNSQGLFDSVKSLGKELLAGPIQLHGETEKGPIKWSGGNVSGKAVHEDEAAFNCEDTSSVLKVNSKVIIQEDGCTKVEMTFNPGKENIAIKKLWLGIPFKDKEVPFFHYIADNNMRFNYAGKTPRGGKIEWYWEKWDGWVPIRWKVAKPGPDDGFDKLTTGTEIWNSENIRQHGNVHKWDHRPFVPYIWLGQEKRGLAFFMESEKGFETDYRKPLQRVIRKGDKVIVQVDIFQDPVTLTKPRTITIGFMASPGKPLEKEFRTRKFASGVGPVSCWGGWQCASKYPTGHDWSIVDKIQEIRKKGKYTDEDDKWFDAKYEEVKKQWPGRKIHGSSDWLWLTKHFAKRAAERGRTHSGTYFEEHATDPRKIEWEVFQDEWASAEFNRFRPKAANWGVFSPSYHNFVLYMANEWMKRGVSLYYDNTNPKRCYSERFGPAFRGPDGALRYGISIFGQREYYRRIYKLLKEWNKKGVPYPIDFTLHITNTQTVPFNTWSTATLDLEQRSHTEDPEKVPEETKIVPREFKLRKDQTMTKAMAARKRGRERRAKKKKGYQLPWTPDYTRTITFGRQSGVIPLALDFVSGHGRHHSNSFTPAMMLRDWSMRRIHNIRPGAMYQTNAKLSSAYEKILLDFGYGNIDQVEEVNYWEKDQSIKVADDRIKWMALRKRDAKADPFGLLLLQSYSRTDDIKSKVTFPGAAALLDIETRELIPAKSGEAEITMPCNLSTRMFLVARKPETLAKMQNKPQVKIESFELTTPVGYNITLKELIYEKDEKRHFYRHHEPEYLPLPDTLSKRFWRIPPKMREAILSYRDDWQELGRDYEFSFRVRLPEESKDSQDRFKGRDALSLKFRYVPQDRKKKIPAKMLQASIRVTRKDTILKWWLTVPQFVEGKKREPLKQLKPVPGKKGSLIPLTESSFGDWVDFGIRLKDKTVQFLAGEKVAAEFEVSQVWPGTFIISQGNLTAHGKTVKLDIADITIIKK